MTRVQTGMTKEQVIAILGQPDHISYSIVDSPVCTLTYFMNNKIGWSELPSVGLDSNGILTYARYSEME